METLKVALNSAGIDTSTFALMTDDSGAGSLYTLQTTGVDTIALWKQLRGLTETTGYWPILFGGAEDVEMHLELLEDADERTPAEIVRQGLALDRQAWLVQAAAEWENEAEDFHLSDYHGEWPKGDHANHEFAVPPDFQRKSLVLGLIPARQSWEVPAVLRLGGWNDCPFTEVHVCLMKSWYERFGAEIVTATHDIIEMQVTRPPQTQQEALALAMEQFFYCEDIVTQGMETIERLAAILLNGTVWYFWWD